MLDGYQPGQQLDDAVLAALREDPSLESVQIQAASVSPGFHLAHLLVDQHHADRAVELLDFARQLHEPDRGQRRPPDVLDDLAQHAGSAGDGSHKAPLCATSSTRAAIGAGERGHRPLAATDAVPWRVPGRLRGPPRGATAIDVATRGRSSRASDDGALAFV